MSGAKPGSHMEGAVMRTIGVFSNEDGEHGRPAGRRAPRWDMDVQVLTDLRRTARERVAWVKEGG